MNDCWAQVSGPTYYFMTRWCMHVLSRTLGPINIFNSKNKRKEMMRMYTRSHKRDEKSCRKVPPNYSSILIRVAYLIASSSYKNARHILALPLASEGIHTSEASKCLNKQWRGRVYSPMSSGSSARVDGHSSLSYRTSVVKACRSALYKQGFNLHPFVLVLCNFPEISWSS